jgi:gentisate 1,2-dioxygenase
MEARMSQAPESARFVDAAESTQTRDEPWPTLMVRREEIDAQIQRLADLPRPESGLRRCHIVHPNATAPGLGFSPGMRVSLEVLRPGESTEPVLHLGAVMGFSIHGSGSVQVGDVEMSFEQYDTWSIPSFCPYQHRNDTDEMQARLTYSTIPVLEMLGVSLDIEDPDLNSVSFSSTLPRERDPLATELFQLPDRAATLRSYEALVDPDTGEQIPAHWSWAEVKEWLSPQARHGNAYEGRPVAMLVHEANDRTVGTTPTLSACYGTGPPGYTMTPHRHSAASIVYHFGGSGRSVVGGRKFEWHHGDLMWGAPGMAIHYHAVGEEHDWALIVQDNALQLAMDNEFWQENLKMDPILIGSHQGYRTNRQQLEMSDG